MHASMHVYVYVYRCIHIHMIYICVCVCTRIYFKKIEPPKPKVVGRAIEGKILDPGSDPQV